MPPTSPAPPAAAMNVWEATHSNKKKTENVQGDEIEKSVVKPLKYENGIKAIANVCVCVSTV